MSQLRMLPHSNLQKMGATLSGAEMTPENWVRALPVGILDEQADDGGGEDAEEDAAADLQDHERAGDGDADQAQEGGAVGDVAEGDQGAVVIGDDAGVLQADEGDEQADTRADGVLERERNRVQDPGAHLS
jgi:hypothetical protein